MIQSLNYQTILKCGENASQIRIDLKQTQSCNLDPDFVKLLDERFSFPEVLQRSRERESNIEKIDFDEFEIYSSILGI